MTSLTNTQESILTWTAFAAIIGLMLLFPDTAFAQTVQDKLNKARQTYAVPIGLGIIGIGATVAVVSWAFDAIDWKTMSKWIFAAMLIGLAGGIVTELAS